MKPLVRGGGHGPYCGPGALAGPVLAGVLLPWLALDRLPVPESAGILLSAPLPAALTLLTGAGAAQAQTNRVLISNTGQSLNLAAAVGGSNQNQRAQAFTTGSHGNGYSIASVELYLLIFSSTNYSNLAVSLYTDNSGNPGTKRFDFTNPGSITLGSNTFTAPSSYVLAPSTTYHVVITNGSNDGSLGVTNSDAEDNGGAAGWSIADTSRGKAKSWGSEGFSLLLGVNGTPQAQASGICDRTKAVRDAIMARVAGVTHCIEITSSDLRGFTGTEGPPAVFNLSNKNLTSLQADDFDGLSGVARLNLNNNFLTSLPSSIFDGLSSLRILYLGNNSLRSLPSDIFDGVSNLSFLDLDNNFLTSLSSDIFDGLSGLESLDLSNNSLRSLPSDIFDGLSLIDLDLSNNFLSTIPEGLFDNVAISNELGLSGNGIVCFPRHFPQALIIKTGLSLSVCYSVSLSVNPDKVGEGDGQQSISLTATLDHGVRRETVTTIIHLLIESGTAEEGEDFTASLGDLPYILIQPGNASATSTFTLTPLQDALAEGNETVKISGAVVDQIGSTTALADGELSGTTLLIDDDDPGVTVRPPTLNLAEGKSGSYTVVLNTLPTAEVTVIPRSSEAGVVSFSPPTLTFTPTSGETPQTVSVTAEEDVDDHHETVTVGHDVSGYGDVSSGDSLSVRVGDDDLPPRYDAFHNVVGPQGGRERLLHCGAGLPTTG